LKLDEQITQKLNNKKNFCRKCQGFPNFSFPDIYCIERIWTRHDVKYARFFKTKKYLLCELGIHIMCNILNCNYISQYTILQHIGLKNEQLNYFLSQKHFCTSKSLDPNMLYSWWKVKYKHLPAADVPSFLYKWLHRLL
jgi:hypothetical protein